MGVMAMEQLSLFDTDFCAGASAKCVWDMFTEEMAAEKPNEWMKKLVPSGEYVIEQNGKSMVLRPAKYSVADIPEGHEYYHYIINGKLYTGVFIGRDDD